MPHSIGSLFSSNNEHVSYKKCFYAVEKRSIVGALFFAQGSVESLASKVNILYLSEIR
jgi:hypothetical protein